MASMGQKPRVLLNILPCTGEPQPPKPMIYSKMSSMPKLRNPALDFKERFRVL